MKKKIISAILLVLSLSMVFCSCSKAPENIDSQIEDAVKNVLTNDKVLYSKFGECYAEGHIVLGYDKVKGGYDVYVMTKATLYGFENGNFVNIMNTVDAGAVIRLNKKFALKNVDYTAEGSLFEQSVMELFPEKYQERLINYSFDDEKIIEDQQKEQAKQYLDSIGREAKIGQKDEFKDLYKNMNDFLIAPKVVKILDRAPELTNYPYWNGNKEAIEKGVRYVYSMEIQLPNDRIVYTKTNYDTNEIVELRYYSSNTGEELK